MIDLDGMLGTTFSRLKERLTYTFTGGKGLGVREFTQEEADLARKQAQQKKLAVAPTVAGYGALIDQTIAQTEMTIAAIRYAGAEVTSMVDTVEALADVAEVTADAVSRLPVAMEKYAASKGRIRENATVLNGRFSQIMSGGADFQEAIESTEQRRFLPR